VARGDELGAAAAAFTQMRTRVRTVIDDLETRVATRTRDIEATQDISRYVATQRDLNTLMTGVVGLIVERFAQIYHAQIFLVEPDGVFAVVRASTGDIGRRLLERGHRLAVGSVSVIGQVTDQGKTILAKDTAVSQVHRRNEFLPDTRSELAIPLRVGESVIGALDVQSMQSDAFPDDLISVLETMADQIAIAIQNARLYEDSLRRVAEIEDFNRQATLRAWQEYLRDQRQSKLISTAGVAVQSEISELRRRALETSEIAVGDATARSTVPIAVPIKLRGQTLGAVEWELPASDVTQDKLELAQELANRLALSLDNARLFQESRRATERERLVNSIAARLTQQTNIDQILQTAVREVGQALRAPQVTIKLREAADQDDSNGTE
jgi:GAF domain-containing protein